MTGCQIKGSALPCGGPVRRRDVQLSPGSMLSGYSLLACLRHHRELLAAQPKLRKEATA